MKKLLKDKKAAILVTNGFEQSEFEKPVIAFKKAGMLVDVISLKKGTVKGWKNKNWGNVFNVDKSLETALSADYDILMLPGGVMNSDILRVDEQAIKFVSEFFDQGKPIAAICHAPWILIETGKLKGKQLTSYYTLKTDIVNAGATWKDAEVVVDGKLITSRNPRDLHAFCKTMIEVLLAGLPPVV